MTLGGFLILSFVSLRIIHLNNSNSESVLTEEQQLITCPVCGYKTLTKDDKLCEECLVELTKQEMIEEEYSSMKEFIEEEQILFFAPDSIVEDIDFYAPKISEGGYNKDFTWKPIASKDTILKFNKEYVEYINDNPIKIKIIVDSLNR